MHEVLVNRLEVRSLARKSAVRLTDRPDMTLDVYRGRKTTIQQQLYSYKFVQLIRALSMLPPNRGNGVDIFEVALFGTTDVILHLCSDKKVIPWTHNVESTLN